MAPTICVIAVIGGTLATSQLWEWFFYGKKK